MTKFKLNFIPSPPSEKDFKFKLPVAFKATNPVLPIKVDLSNNCTSVKNQGTIGSCTAHATVSLMEYIHHACGDRLDKQDLFSEKFTYYVTRVNIMYQNPDEDTGAYLRTATESLVKYGVAREELCPYDESYSDQPSKAAYKDASRNQAIAYGRIKEYESESKRIQTLMSCKLSLSEGKPFTGGFICYENLYDGENGMIPSPVGNQIGGHAVFFVGYDDNISCFKFKNSWGPEWGDKGYGYLPYEYLLKGLLTDMWTVTKIENFSDFKSLELKKPKTAVLESTEHEENKNMLQQILDKIDLVLEKLN